MSLLDDFKNNQVGKYYRTCSSGLVLEIINPRSTTGFLAKRIDSETGELLDKIAITIYSPQICHEVSPESIPFLRQKEGQLQQQSQSVLCKQPNLQLGRVEDGEKEHRKFSGLNKEADSYDA